jgi:hypothetical protein
MVRVHDLIEEDLPDPERDKVGFLNAACFSIHSSKNPFATSVGNAPIDGENDRSKREREKERESDDDRDPRYKTIEVLDTQLLRR